jgi:aminopeptidase-like protein
MSYFDSRKTGDEMYRLIAELYPICRSITGEGVRDTLRVISQHIPLDTHEVPTGTQVFDWSVPKEWNITDAYIKNLTGERLVDFRKSNLHVVNYSTPVRSHVSLAELKDRVFTLPDHPDWIPYRTSYYHETWGFCLSQTQWNMLKDDTYEVCIDSSLRAGSLTYGEYCLQGESSDEILISCHICHPSLANDNLSGVGLAVYLAKHVRNLPRQYSYRFLFIPGTIGSITWLALNEEKTSRIKHGLVLASLGAGDKFTYKRSRRGDAQIDRAVGVILRDCGVPYDVVDFSPYGYDERQFCSPAFNLPVGCFMRTPNGSFPEYHTSADNLEFIQPALLGQSYAAVCEIISLLEANRTYVNQNPKCEPQLGRRGLYRKMGGVAGADDELAMLWLLNLSDGNHSLLDIAERSKCSVALIRKAAEMLVIQHLLK